MGKALPAPGSAARCCPASYRCVLRWARSLPSGGFVLAGFLGGQGAGASAERCFSRHAGRGEGLSLRVAWHRQNLGDASTGQDGEFAGLQETRQFPRELQEQRVAEQIGDVPGSGFEDKNTEKMPWWV